MAKIQIQSLVLGMVATNVSFLQNTETKELILIDPADRPDVIDRKIGEMEGIPTAILLTHGHYDHILAADVIRNKYHIPVYAHELEEEVLENPMKNLSGSWGSAMSTHADRLLKDNEEIILAGLKIRVLHTPGHTQGSCCFYLPDEKVLFSGDTMFCGSYGRVDFPTSNARSMEDSIRRLVRDIPEDVSVYPGHEMFTSIAFEKRYNPLAY